MRYEKYLHLKKQNELLAVLAQKIIKPVSCTKSSDPDDVEDGHLVSLFTVHSSDSSQSVLSTRMYFEIFLSRRDFWRFLIGTSELISAKPNISVNQ